MRENHIKNKHGKSMKMLPHFQQCRRRQLNQMLNNNNLCHIVVRAMYIICHMNDLNQSYISFQNYYTFVDDEKGGGGLVRK